MEREDPAFHDSVSAAYLEAAGPGIYHLDADRPAPEVLEAAWARLVSERPETFGVKRTGAGAR